MSITPRIPKVNWKKGFKKHWNGNNPPATHAFNALSFMFPQGERFFIKVAKEVSQKHTTPLSPKLKKDIQAFITQEAMHTKQHQFYNENLEKLGYQNVTYSFVDKLEKLTHKYFSTRRKLAIVCAYEHYTAVLGNYLLTNPQILRKAPKELSLIWGWHSVEETEHKAVCFDLYNAVGGSWFQRIMAFLLVSFDFFIIFSYLYISLLWRDDCFNIKNMLKTMLQMIRFFWGVKGVGWHIVFYGIRYLSPKFHPWDQNNKHLVKNWLTLNKAYLKELPV